jgi:hypothetical protein
MKFIYIILVLASIFACKNNIIGSTEVTEITYVEFSQINNYNNGAWFEVTGHIKNISSTQTIPSSWHIECQFYADDTKVLKLGGENTIVYIPLESEQSTIWTIRWLPGTNSNININDFPDWTYDDLRAYLK